MYDVGRVLIPREGWSTLRKITQKQLPIARFSIITKQVNLFKARILGVTVVQDHGIIRSSRFAAFAYVCCRTDAVLQVLHIRCETTSYVSKGNVLDRIARGWDAWQEGLALCLVRASMILKSEAAC